ncbi:MAG: flagellar export protein FliJ [Lachnospiraceae bacterium]
MAKFIFRLQNVLDVKLKLESQAKTAFSMAAAKVNEEEEKLEQLFARRAELEAEYRRKSTGKLNIHEMKFARDNVEYIKGQIKIQQENLMKARRALEIARTQLNDAMKDRKIYEKLKENAFQEFLREENENEKKEIDQLVSFRFNGNGKAGAN